MSHSALDILEESVHIARAAGDLAGVLAYPLAAAPTRAALIVGPHPLMGGRLTNNVVRHVGRGLAERGLLTLRFQFAGDGVDAAVMDEFWRTGRAPQDPARGAEVLAAADWLRQLRPLPTIAVGYSFGASLLGSLLEREQVQGAALIGGTFAQHDFSALAASVKPKLVLAADNDFATPLATTQAWVEAAAPPKTLVVVPAAEHFYRGQEERLVEEIARWLPS